MYFWKLWLLAFAIFLVENTWAQSFVQKGYYQFPIAPGNRNYLSGSMGELRTNHFHAGLDIKTGGQVGLPVHASAKGYVYRIKVSSRGYGKVLYLQHPNGQRTVYGHLQKFDEAIEQYVIDAQYQQETFEIELFPEPGRFAFEQGEVIARSGNTGSSAGPHLHFEIRKNNDVALNPLLFGFEEVVDNMPPQVSRIAIQPLDFTATVSGKGERQEWLLLRTRGGYRMPQTITAHGWVGIEFQGVDRANYTSNTYGINQVEMTVNGEMRYRHTITAVPFEVSRQINLFKNYSAYRATRRNFQKCYRDDGNLLPFYEGEGKLRVEDGQTYRIKITCYDSYGNSSSVLLTIIGKKSAGGYARNVAWENGDNGLGYNIDHNQLLWWGDGQKSTVTISQQAYQLSPIYLYEDRYYYCWDLRKGLPDLVSCGAQTVSRPVKQVFYPGFSYTYYDKHLRLQIPDSALHDTLYFDYALENKRLQLGNSDIPLFKPIEVQIKVDSAAVGEHTGAYEIDGRIKVYAGGKLQQGWLSFGTQYFGEYILEEDDNAPSIYPISLSSNRLAFRIKDYGAGIARFRATLNGAFLLMYYDHRKDLIWSVKKHANEPLKGDFVLLVWDKQGNRKRYSKKL